MCTATPYRPALDAKKDNANESLQHALRSIAACAEGHFELLLNGMSSIQTPDFCHRLGMNKWQSRLRLSPRSPCQLASEYQDNATTPKVKKPQPTIAKKIARESKKLPKKRSRFGNGICAQIQV